MDMDSLAEASSIDCTISLGLLKSCIRIRTLSLRSTFLTGRSDAPLSRDGMRTLAANGNISQEGLATGIPPTYLAVLLISST